MRLHSQVRILPLSALLASDIPSTNNLNGLRMAELGTTGGTP